MALWKCVSRRNDAEAKEVIKVFSVHFFIVLVCKDRYFHLMMSLFCLKKMSQVSKLADIREGRVELDG